MKALQAEGAVDAGAGNLHPAQAFLLRRQGLAPETGGKSTRIRAKNIVKVCMRSVFFFAILAFCPWAIPLASGAGLAQAAQATPGAGIVRGKMCGWFINPTPQNIWLDTAAAEWTLGLQGEYRAQGEWHWPRFAPGQWVVTNRGEHGYGCACVQGTFNAATKQAMRINRVTARPLRACRQDAALHAREPETP